MTTEEFSNEFDVLINSYSRSLPTGYTETPIEFDEYEKSVFLTNAQEELILSYYNGFNQTRQSFEDTEEVRRYLSSLIKDVRITEKEDFKGIYNNSVFYRLPADLWFITYEAVNINDESNNCSYNQLIGVQPVTQDEFFKTYKNPFRGANKRRVLRLDYGTDKNNDIVELVSKYNIEEYIVRYISKPNPIILTSLPDGLTINNISTITECVLNPALHRTILKLAVMNAFNSRVGGNSDANKLNKLKEIIKE